MKLKPCHPLLVVASLSFLLAILKMLAFAATGSMIVLSSALDSIGDTVISFINFRMYLFAKKMADKEHPYGHGGFEVISSLIQGLALSLLASIIIYQSFSSLLTGNYTLDLQHVIPAFSILFFAAISGAALQWYLHRFEKQLKKTGEQSLSVQADRAHYLGDFFMNLASACALLIVWWLDLFWIDAVAGLIAGCIMLRIAYPILTNVYQHITNQEVESEIQKELVNLILTYHPAIHNLHRFRTRRLGPTFFIDFHLKLDSDLSLKASHQIADQLERVIRQKHPQADITIHVDPADESKHAEDLLSYHNTSDLAKSSTKAPKTRL